MQNGLKLRFTITCKKCGKSWECRTEYPKECIYCRSRSWYKEPTEPVVVNVPLPKVDHSVPLPLKEGGHCPYEVVRKSHTIILNSDLSPIKYYCSSCDAIFDLYGNSLGVKLGIGAKR
jgi:DNA-directed RNA polymerase subunit RPC12/RpoP